jgi:titin
MRTVARVIAAATTSLLLVGLVPGVAHAAGSVTPSPTSHFNDAASFPLTLTTGGTYLRGATVNVRLDGGPGGDAKTVSGTVTGTHTVSATLNLQNMNIGLYDVSVLVGQTPVDQCTDCFTVDGYAPTGLAISPSTFAAGTSADGADGTNAGFNGFTISGQGFTTGAYTQCTGASLDACGDLSIAIVPAGGTNPDESIVLGDTKPSATAATPTSIVKRINVATSAVAGSYDVIVYNTAAKSATCAGCLVIRAELDVTNIELKVDSTKRLTHIGDNAVGQTVIVTGKDLPSDAVVSFVKPAADAGSITFTGASAPVTTTAPVQEITLTGVDTTQVAASGVTDWDLLVSSASLHAVSRADDQSESLTVSPAPGASSVSYAPFSSTGALGQGAQDVAIDITGTNLDLDGATYGTRAVFASLPSGVTLGTQVVSGDGIGTVTVPMDIAAGTAVGGYTFHLVNPDGGRSATCDNSTMVPPASNTCLLTIAAGPQITTITPSAAARGASKTLTITGTGLHSSVAVFIGPDGGANWVTNNNRTVSNGSFTVNVAVPANAAVGNVDVVVTNVDDKGQAVAADAFTVSNLSVDSVSPSSWTNDSIKTLTISGTNISASETSQVLLTKLGQATIPGTSITGSGPITASFDLRGVAPGVYDVKAINPTGTHLGEGVCTGCFTVTAAAPTASGASPSTLGGGASNVTVTINGTNFFPGSTVTFSNAKVTPVGSPTFGTGTISQVVNVASDATANTGTVTVTNTDGQTASTAFSTAAAPSVSGISPAQKPVGSSFPFTINGSGFSTSPAPTLSFGGAAGVSAGTVTVNAGGTQLTTTLTIAGTATPGTLPVTVINADQGRASSPTSLTLTAQPVITGIDTGKSDATTAPAGQSVPLQVVGSGFQSGLTLAPQGAGSGLTITNVARSSATLVTATLAVDPSAAAGARTLVLTNPDGGATTTQLFVIRPPSVPQTMAATGGVRQASISWAAPAADGGSAVTSYTVTLTNTATGGTSPAPVTVNALGTTFTGLANGATYAVSVVATNGAGNSPAATGTVTTSTFPGAPGSLALTGGVHQIAVTWQAPASNGGSAVTSYTVRATNNANPADTHTSPAVGGTSYTVPGLASGATYTVSVVATNLVGDSPAASGAATTTGVPGAPTAVAATSGVRQLGVSWQPPASDGGSPVTSYSVSAVNTADATDTASSGVLASSARSFPLTGLRNGATYAVSVRATSLAGDSGAATATATTYALPGTPTGVTAVPGDKKVTVSWAAPAGDGGTPITGYRVVMTPGSVTQTVTGTSVVVSGLVNGTTYTFTVAATNAVGDSAPSAGMAARPMGTSVVTLDPLSSRVIYGTKITLRGVVSRSDTSVTPSQVRILVRNDAGSWSTLALVTPSSTGAYSFTTTPSINRFYYARYAGDSKNTGFTTLGRKTLVAPKISAYAPTGSHAVSQVITGSVYPVKPGKVVTLYRVTSTGGLVKLRSATLSSNSTYRFSITLPAGTTRLRVVIPATTNNTSGYVTFAAKRT